MKNIAIDARPLSAELTGIGRYLYNLLESILKKDTENQYFLYSTSPLKHKFSNYQNVHLRNANVKNKAIELLFSQLVFPWWCRKDNIDTFWSPRHHLPLILGFSKKIKKVVTAHDIVWLKYPETMSKYGYLIEKIFFRPSMKIADKILVLSQFTQNEMIKHLGIEKEKILVTGVGCFSQNIKNDDLDQSLDIGDKYFLFVGTLEPRKNLKNILIAFKQLAKQDKEINLVVVGKDGWGNIKINDIITEFDLEQRVKRLGFVTDSVLTHLYKKCEGLLMPSIYEGFGFPALEALSYKKKVLVTKYSAIAEMKGDNIFVSKTESESIFFNMITLLNVKPKFHAKIMKSWDDSALNTLEILER